jgi:pyruvate/2-oxoglutarate dehydrogenase complex dihydrolipoamide acyltransferase (E2) component
MEEITLPKWGVTMQEATLSEWLVKVGDEIEEGQPVANVETDKVDGEVESPAAGVIAEILVEAGQQIPVGTVLATLTTSGG